MMPEENSSSFDPLACSNANSAWGALIMEVLVRLGVETVVVSPGSRSTPLALAAARNPKLEAIPILDERTAGFFALGLAKRTHKPVALVCTSGSAVANYYPSVLEASMSGTPLLVLTADRPAELRDCSAGQTIDQVKVFGGLVRYFHELALPEANPDMLAYLRQTLVHAVHHSLQNPGPVHLNFPFREPLSPSLQDTPAVSPMMMETAATVTSRLCEMVAVESHLDSVALERLISHQRGLIIIGNANPSAGEKSFVSAVGAISKKLGWPILSDVLNPLRSHYNEDQALVCHYDILLRNSKIAEEWKPSAILQIGPLPTSKILRQWLAGLDAVSFLLSDRLLNTDPLHRVATPLQGTVHALNKSVQQQKVDAKWVSGWSNLEKHASAAIEGEFEKIGNLFEGKISWLLSRNLPEDTPIFIANSMSVRYAEYFWCAGDRGYSVHCNRGANGIDGTLGTAMGMAHRSKPAVLLTGDLAFLHDTNALLTASELSGSLTIVMLNNDGGGIFEHLPVAGLGNSFERCFATPQAVEFEKLCSAYGVNYQQVTDLEALIESIRILPEKGVRLLEVPTDRKRDKLLLDKLLKTQMSFQG